jgi:transglutaminase-like putative cysteine protease
MIIDISVRLDYALQGLTTLLLQIEAASLPDQSIVSTETNIQDAKSFTRIPAEDGVGERSWISLSDRFAASYDARVEIDRPAPDLGSLPATPLNDLPGETVTYLMDSRFIPAERFGTFVEGTFGKLKGGARIAAMRDWIEKNLDYVAGASNATTTAIDTFVSRQGVCRDYAHLMVGFARASQIPARCVSVFAPSVEPPDFHMVSEVWLDGAWRLVDPTGMAKPDEMARIGVGRDAADISFLMIFGSSELTNQSVAVKRA